MGEEPGRPLLQSLCAHLAPQRVLLVIDKASIDYGVEPYQVPPESLNDLIAGSPGLPDPTADGEGYPGRNPPDWRLFENF